jgi:hypothetical protein
VKFREGSFANRSAATASTGSRYRLQHSSGEYHGYVYASTDAVTRARGSTRQPSTVTSSMNGIKSAASV